MNRNAYCSVGTLMSKSSIEDLEQRLLLNYDVISKFNNIVVAHNYVDGMKSYITEYNKIWYKLFGNNVIIKSFPSRGHSIGSADLDNCVIHNCKLIGGIDFIYKSSNDILLLPSILNIELTPEYDFYYLEGIGYTGMESAEFDVNKFISKWKRGDYFYPQTNFYIINSNVDYINDENTINNAYENVCREMHYSGKLWEYTWGFDCESLLKKCIIRNQFKYKHILSDMAFKNLLKYILDYKICDPSHKNILFEELGVCHFQHPQHNVTVI